MIYSFLYVLVYSAASVFIEKLYFSISPFFSLLVTACIATFYFNIVNIGKLKKIYAECWREKKLWLGIMVTVLIMWNCTMTAPGLIGASLYNFLYFSWLGALGFLSLCIIDWKKNNMKLFAGIGILILIIITLWLFLGSAFTKVSLLGIFLALLGGSSAFIYFKQSQTLIKRIQLSATQILAVRLYLTIILLVIIFPKDNISTLLTVKNMLELALLAVMSLIIPLYFQQKALEKISSEQNAIIMSLSPVVSAFMQQMILGDVDSKFIIIYILYSLIIAGSYISNKRLSTEKRNDNQAK